MHHQKNSNSNHRRSYRTEIKVTGQQEDKYNFSPKNPHHTNLMEKYDKEVRSGLYNSAPHAPVIISCSSGEIVKIQNMPPTKAARSLGVWKLCNLTDITHMEQQIMKWQNFTNALMIMPASPSESMHLYKSLFPHRRISLYHHSPYQKIKPTLSKH